MKRDKKKINSWLDGSVVIKDIFQKNRVLLVIIFFMSLFLIWNNHYTESTVRKINKYNREIEELRYTHLSTTNELTSISRPSSVARILKETGIKESKTPPTKIKTDRSRD
ncbi:MAG: hypothetical protein LBC49_04020 [Bacteroidales bacterium]|jgi:cell division protein FtsL|nr:hypothetical protein [Bacteroidales bacterium]